MTALFGRSKNYFKNWFSLELRAPGLYLFVEKVHMKETKQMTLVGQKGT